MLERGKSPDLAAALRGVTHVRLFTASEGVDWWLPEDEVMAAAAAESVTVVLPPEPWQALAIHGEMAPAVQL